MPKIHPTRLALLATCLATSQAASQRVPVVGESVRVHTGAPAPATVGTVRSISSQSIQITDSDGGPRFFPAGGIRDLEVSQGQYLREGSPAWALLSFAAMTAAGAGIGALIWSPCTDTRWFACLSHPESRGDAALLGAGLSLPVGLLIAYAVGKDRLSDRWEKARLPAPGPSAGIRMYPSPEVGRIGVDVSVPLPGP